MNTLQERIAELFNGEMPSDDEIISHIDFSIGYKKTLKVEIRLKSIITYLFNYKHKVRYMIPAAWDEHNTSLSYFDYNNGKDEWCIELCNNDNGYEKYAEIIIPNSWVVEDDWKPLIDAVTDDLRKKEDEAKRTAAKDKFKNRLANKPPVIIHPSMETAWIEMSDKRGCVFMGDAHGFRSWVNSTRPRWLNDRVITSKAVDDFAYEYQLQYTIEYITL